MSGEPVLVLIPSLRLTAAQQVRVSGTLAWRRRRAGLELEDVSARAGVRPWTWLSWERGVPWPSLAWPVIASAVGVDLVVLLDAAGEP